MRKTPKSIFNTLGMKKILVAASFAFVLLTAAQSAVAQYYFFDDTYFDKPVLYEAGISANAMNCLTDLGGKKGIGKKFIKDLNTGYTHFSGGIFFSASYKNMFSMRLEGTFGQISGDDKILVGITDIAKQRYNRNQSFRSNISEATLMLEAHPLFIFVDWLAKDKTAPRYSPYVIGGIGYFSFNPQTKVGNRWVDLQPLHTEGQGFAEYPDRKEYKLNQLMIPLGAGVKYELTPLINVRAEFLYRKTFTDYIDDVSTTYIDPALFSKYLSGGKLTNALAIYDKQRIPIAGINGKRGTATNNDGYFTAGIKVSVVIGRDRIRKY
jgi:opacity protein-like surface antigen